MTRQMGKKMEKLPPGKFKLSRLYNYSCCFFFYCPKLPFSFPTPFHGHDAASSSDCLRLHRVTEAISTLEMEDWSAKMAALRQNEENFGFAFDDSALSDRVLSIKIVPDDSPCSDTNNKYLKWFSRVDGDDDSNSSDLCAEVKLKTLHISSPILAALSPFFYKLFKNGMRESHHRDVTLVVNASEEAALLELLYFMYHKTLRVTTESELLDVLMAADKFEVVSCMICCVQLLIKMPMSLESALLYLELPLSVSMAEIVQPLLDSAKQYLSEKYKDFTKSQEELMELPLSALEVVLGSDCLQVDTENEIYDFILKWARAHYTNLEERKEILTNHLTQLINFPYMRCDKLKEVAACEDFDNGEVSKLVIQALCDKVEVPYGKHIHRPKVSVLGRAYTFRLIKAVYLEFPWPHCVVYFDLRRDECANLIPSKYIFSDVFLLGGKLFSLVATNEQHNFGLCLLRVYGSNTGMVGCEFAVMNKSSKRFVSSKANTFTDKVSGVKNLLGLTWDKFMEEDCEYFIDGIMHIRADVMIHSISEE